MGAYPHEPFFARWDPTHPEGRVSEAGVTGVREGGMPPFLKMHFGSCFAKRPLQTFPDFSEESRWVCAAHSESLVQCTSPAPLLRSASETEEMRKFARSENRNRNRDSDFRGLVAGGVRPPRCRLNHLWLNRPKRAQPRLPATRNRSMQADWLAWRASRVPMYGLRRANLRIGQNNRPMS
jgi:hypothetical protein